VTWAENISAKEEETLGMDTVRKKLELTQPAAALPFG
jgi:hypothetical protein